MLALIALSGVAVVGFNWALARQRQTPLERALGNQAAEVVTAPDRLTANAIEDVALDPDVCTVTTITAVATGDGSIRWSTEVPSGLDWFRHGFSTVNTADDDQLLLGVDPDLGSRPPSVVAVNTADGALAWQRYLAADFLHPIAASQTSLVVAASINPSSTQTPAATNEDLVFCNPDTGLTDARLPIPIDGEYFGLGSDASPGESIQVTDEHVLLVIGSTDGPDTRLAVFDTEPRGLLWTLDDARAAALAGDAVLYDVRNDEAVDAESTRDLYLVDADDPESVRWSTALDVNEIGGNGFLGTANDAVIFAVTDDDDEFDFLTITDSADVPNLVRAAEGFGSGASIRHHLDDEVWAAVTDDGVVLSGPDTATSLVTTEDLADGWRPVALHHRLPLAETHSANDPTRGGLRTGPE